MHRDPHLFDTSDVSYSVRGESTLDVLRNRVGVTASLFVTAVGLSLVLGRRRS